MKDLSIIIVHHQTPGLLKLCLKSIEETTTGIDYEVIVVDSTISREAKDLIEDRSPRTFYLPFKENLGYARGVNIGITRSSGRYIQILNPDIILTDGCLVKMLEYMKNRPDIGILGPKMLNFNGTLQKNYFSFYRPATIIARRSFLGRFSFFKKALDDFLMSDANPRNIQTPDWLMGSALMINKEVLDKVGGMDEMFFMYFEDVDWARRFWHNDFKVIYYPKVVVYHYHQRESVSGFGLLDILFNRKTRWHIISAVKFFWKYRNLDKMLIYK